jgi:dihydroxyacetone kinase
MKKLINDAADYVDEALDGLCAGFDGYRRAGRDGRVIARSDAPVQGKVGVVTGGGFGHLPVFAGYVSAAMLDASAVGNVFAGHPTARRRVVSATKRSHGAIEDASQSCERSATFSSFCSVRRRRGIGFAGKIDGQAVYATSAM